MFNVLILGAGQLGSRHLQALKNVKYLLNIAVVDVSNKSLVIAKERYEAMEIKTDHIIRYLDDINLVDKYYDLVINATNSNVRHNVIDNFLKVSSSKYLIMEKLLFNQREHYQLIDDVLKEKEIKAWVNCSMRLMEFYSGCKNFVNNAPISYLVTGSNYGLITNSIHYIDHMCFLVNDTNFEIETKGLHKKLYKSKREGFFELNGTLTIRFSNGSLGILSCYLEGDAPVVVEIMNENFRCISRETENKAFFSSSLENWEWKEKEARIPFQSETTTRIVTKLIENGTCDLVEFSESKNTHIKLLDALQNFLKENNLYTKNFYPFT